MNKHLSYGIGLFLTIISANVTNPKNIGDVAIIASIVTIAYMVGLYTKRD